MNAKTIKEFELAGHLPRFLEDLGLGFIAKEVRIGSFRLDAIASDPDGGLVVVEFKTNASITTLGQLLLYPHALRKTLVGLDIRPPRIRSLLITTFLDSNVYEISRELKAHSDIEILVCVGAYPDGLKLVKPDQAGEQMWDQSSAGGNDMEAVLAHVVRLRSAHNLNNR